MGNGLLDCASSPMVPAAAVVWVTAVATGDVSGDGVGPLGMAHGWRASGCWWDHRDHGDERDGSN